MAKNTARVTRKPKATRKPKVTLKPKVTRKPKKGSRNFTSWTPADEKNLRKLAGKMPTEKVAKTLNRSVAAVTFKAFSLRLSLRLAKSNRGRRLGH